MSRRAPRTQLTITASDSRTPAITNGKKIVTPEQAHGDADRQEQRLDARAGEVDLLARGRDVGVQRRHQAM